MDQSEPRDQASGGEPTPTGHRSDKSVRWELRRTRSSWQRFLERFGFTLIALGIAMMVGVLIGRMG